MSCECSRGSQQSLNVRPTRSRNQWEVEVEVGVGVEVEVEVEVRSVKFVRRFLQQNKWLAYMYM